MALTGSVDAVSQVLVSTLEDRIGVLERREVSKPSTLGRRP